MEIRMYNVTLMHKDKDINEKLWAGKEWRHPLYVKYQEIVITSAAQKVETSSKIMGGSKTNSSGRLYPIFQWWLSTHTFAKVRFFHIVPVYSLFQHTARTLS